MELFLKILMAVFGFVSVTAAVYNIFSSRTIAQEQGQKAKVEQALALGLDNKKDIEHLKELARLSDDATEKRLNQIGDDVGFVKDLLVKWLLDATKKT